jgi:enterochelin esterase family protein
MRAILGTSYGGVCATYFSFSCPDVFKLAAIQSPAYWNMTKLLQEVIDNKDTSVKYFMSTGTINDGETITKMVYKHLLQKKCNILYKESNEGHSWGNWKALLDDMLIYFFKK